MKIWHTTIVAVFTAAMLVLGVAWPYEESKDSALNQEEPLPQMDDLEETTLEQEAANIQSSYKFRHVYSLDMTIPTQHCPHSLHYTTYNSLRLCKRHTGGGCSSIIISTKGKSYKEVRGKVTAYQFGSPDGFSPSHANDINKGYVDGISITYGKYPKKHIWTYAMGFRQFSTRKYAPGSTCPRNGGRQSPSFVGDDYFCSSGNPSKPGQPHWSSVLYLTPLWSNILGDCSDCGKDELYFCKKLPSPTTDDLEVRVCTDQNTHDENIYVESMDFYVR